MSISASVTCPSTSFTCSNGKCIDRNLICDDTDDCGDNSDEHTCFIKASGNCELGEKPCSSNTSICVSTSSICNGTKECPQGEDEENCSKCVEMEYTCNNRKCIPFQWVCDGFDDCHDNSDENNCSSVNTTAIMAAKTPLASEICDTGYRY